MRKILKDDPWRYSCPKFESRDVVERKHKGRIENRGSVVDGKRLMIVPPFYCRQCNSKLEEVYDLKAERMRRVEIPMRPRLRGYVNRLGIEVAD